MAKIPETRGQALSSKSLAAASRSDSASKTRADEEDCYRSPCGSERGPSRKVSEKSGPQESKIRSLKGYARKKGDIFLSGLVPACLQPPLLIVGSL